MFNIDIARWFNSVSGTRLDICRRTATDSSTGTATNKIRNTRNITTFVPALLLSLLIISSASSLSTFMTSAIQMPTFIDGETPSVLLSPLLPSVLAKSYERNAIGDRLEMRDSQLYEGDQASQPSAPNTTPIMIEDLGKGAEDNIMNTAAINPGDLVHVLWQDDTPGNFDVFHKRAGADFDPSAINLSSNPADSFGPVVAVSGNNVYIVWEEGSEIFYKRSTDRGGTFGAAVNLSDNSGGSTDPKIAASGNNVHVVWQDDTPGNFDILYRRSTDGGVSFTDPIKNLSANAGASINPAIAASDNNVHVVWGDDTATFPFADILYRRSTNGGSTFPNIITNLSANAGGSGNPEIAISGDNVHLVWQDETPGNFDILYRRSTDGGSSFTDPIKNLSSNIGSSDSPAIVAIDSIVNVVWEDNTPGNNDILYRRSTNGGSTFPNIITNLSDNAGSSAVPAIAAIDSNVYVVWGDDTGLVANPDILYRPSEDNGVTFDPTITNLSANTGTSSFPSIAVSS